MLKDIKNILLYNSGGGLGDSLLMIPLMQWLKEFYKLSKIYYIQNGKNEHFNSSLNEFKEPIVETLDFLPENFAPRNFCGIYFCDFALFRKNKFKKTRRKFVHPQK